MYILWLFLAFVLGMVVGMLGMGIFSLASEQEDSEERSAKCEHSGIR